jgi:hypothetical protein
MKFWELISAFRGCPDVVKAVLCSPESSSSVRSRLWVVSPANKPLQAVAADGASVATSRVPPLLNGSMGGSHDARAKVVPLGARLPAIRQENAA